MKKTWYLKMKGFGDAIIRYPFTTVFLVIGAVVNFYSIATDTRHTTIIFSCFVGGVLSASMQVLWERFYSRQRERILGIVLSVIVAIAYYFLIEAAPEFGIEIQVRTAVTLFALFFLFIWLPVIKSDYVFHQNFMAIFKGLFQAIFYAGVIFLGCTLIISAIDLLILEVDEKAFMYSANAIFVLFAPIFFLSLVPRYPGKSLEKGLSESQKTQLNHAISCPRFLEILLSYIIIPIVAVYTLVLLLYIIINVRGEFWSNNLLEPLLVSYAVAVILVFLLVSELKNKFVLFFIRVFPKMLMPIMIFQIIASILISFDTGITFTRYYVILFGIFATISGFIMSIFKTNKNAYITAVLIISCLFSVIPPFDAFLTSRNSQIKILESTLKENEMLINQELFTKDISSISKEDRNKITMSMEYLDRMDELDRLEWISDDFVLYKDFEDTFGFTQYYSQNYDDTYRSFSYRMNEFINISKYDHFIEIFIDGFDEDEEWTYSLAEKGNLYTLQVLPKEKLLILVNDEGQTLISYSLNNLSEDLPSDKFNSFNEVQLTSEDATITIQENSVTMTIVVKEMYMDTDMYYVNLYVFLDF